MGTYGDWGALPAPAAPQQGFPPPKKRKPPGDPFAPPLEDQARQSMGPPKAGAGGGRWAGREGSGARRMEVMVGQGDTRTQNSRGVGVKLHISEAA